MTANEIDIDATEDSNLEAILARQAGMSRFSSVPHLLAFSYNMLWNMTGKNADFWKPRLLYCKMNCILMDCKIFVLSHSISYCLSQNLWLVPPKTVDEADVGR